MRTIGSRRTRRLIGSVVCALLLSAGLSTAALADAASSTVTPVPGAPLIFGHAEFDLGTVGYTQSEFFYEGTAKAYGAPTPLTSDGKWTATPSHEAAFKTRMVVNRPSNPRRFNGTVLVEWFNVSGGVDGEPGLAAHARRADPTWLCLGGRLRAGRRREPAEVPDAADTGVSDRSLAGRSGSRRPGPLRNAQPPW